MMNSNTAVAMADIDHRAEEQKVLREITEKLVLAREADQPTSGYHDALNSNRTLWSALRKDVMSKSNLLPKELCDQIDQLGAWVEAQTVRVLRGEGKIDTLIVVNQNIIEGLG
jgi:flagellar biosynthesis regulator FlaF